MLAPSVAFQGQIGPILRPGASISRPSYGDVCLTNYVEGMLGHFELCWCLQLCKNACPQQDQCFSGASCDDVGPFIGTKSGLLGSCWHHLGGKFHHLEAILATCVAVLTMLAPFWCQVWPFRLMLAPLWKNCSAILWPFWGHVGTKCNFSGPCWPHLKTRCVHFVAILGRCWH